MEIPHHIPRCCPIILRMAKYRKTSAILPQQNPIVFSSRNNMKLRGLRGSAETSVNKYELNTYLGIGHIAENPKMVCK